MAEKITIYLPEPRISGANTGGGSSGEEASTGSGPGRKRGAEDAAPASAVSAPRQQLKPEEREQVERAQALALEEAADSGAALCEECETAKRALKSARG